MLKSYAVIIGVFCVFGTGITACSDSDINHPVLCYHHKRVIDASPHDSVLIGKMIFDPLPEYQ
ncbi:MAG: hypothetical protein PHR28_06355, partial [candidate division Zixibacteria bacterium]|nr:hypothetical protein [candidate division Zixibacteria bacterium]